MWFINGLNGLDRWLCEKMVAIHWFHGRPRTKKRCLLAVWWVFCCVSPLLSKELQATLWYLNIAVENHTVAMLPYQRVYPHIHPHNHPYTPMIPIIYPLYPHSFPTLGGYPLVNVYITCGVYPPFVGHFPNGKRFSTTFGMLTLGPRVSYRISIFPSCVVPFPGFSLWSLFLLTC